MTPARGGAFKSGAAAMSHRAAARLAWLLCAVGLLSLASMTLLLIFLGLSTALPAGWTPRWEQVISAVGVIGAPILGGLIASRRPENPYGGCGSASASCNSRSPTLPTPWWWNR